MRGEIWMLEKREEEINERYRRGKRERISLKGRDSRGKDGIKQKDL